MTLYNCFNFEEDSIKLAFLKVNCLTFLFEIIEESHINNINILHKALETLKMILVFAINGSDNLFIILEDRIKRSNLPTILDKISFSNNQDISMISQNIKDILNFKD
jgi:hypothetical protein